MQITYEEESIINYSKRFREKISKANVNLNEIKNDPRFSTPFSLLFHRRIHLFFGGDELYLEGTDPLVSFDFVYHALNKTTFSSEPWYIVMDMCADFFELYNASIQERTTFVAKSKTINAEDYIIPLFIIFLSCKNSYSKIRPSLLMHDGQIIFRFECDPANLPNSFIIKESGIYKLLIDVFKLEEKAKVDSILDNELEIETQKTVIIIRKHLFSVKSSIKKERIIKYIRAKRVVSAQELADYFNLSKRMINYYIAELIKEGVVIREGPTNSSIAKYRISDNYYY